MTHVWITGSGCVTDRDALNRGWQLGIVEMGQRPAVLYAQRLQLRAMPNAGDALQGPAPEDLE